MPIKEIIEARLSQHIVKISQLQGGDINDVYDIQTPDNRYVVKLNDKYSFPKMFEKEANGLNKLAKNGAYTPQVIDLFDHEEDQFLVLAYIEPERPAGNFWKHFGQALSTLHNSKFQHFGLEEDNYIGSLCQINKYKDTWEAFFIENRIQPLVRMAFDQQLLDRRHLKYFDVFSAAFEMLVPKEKPSLIHGDLWSGNLLCGLGQTPVFIDPAIYYGHREMDIAMTAMFGGFDKTFLDFYNDIMPLENGWEQRLSLHNLYPNLVHLVLFGKSYLGGIERIIKKFG
jgi:fructosamine-3-kinase